MRTMCEKCKQAYVPGKVSVCSCGGKVYPQEVRCCASCHPVVTKCADAQWGEDTLAADVLGDAAQVKAKWRIEFETGPDVDCGTTMRIWKDDKEVASILAFTLSLSVDDMAPDFRVLESHWDEINPYTVGSKAIPKE